MATHTARIARDHCLAPERADAAVAAGWPFFGRIIDAEPESFRAVDPLWSPTLPSHEPGRFGVADILVPPPEAL